MKIRKKLRRDTRAEEIYKEINQEDVSIEMRKSQIFVQVCNNLKKYQ